MKGSTDLLTQIEIGAHDPESDVPSLLRLCIKLGSETSTERLREWASLELKGYGSDDDLPQYRLIGAPLQLDGILGNTYVRRKPVPHMLIPDFARDSVGSGQVRMAQPIAELVDLLASARKEGGDAIKLGPYMAPELVALMNSELAKAEQESLFGGYSPPPSQQIDRIYWSINPAPIAGIVDRVRTNLVELVAEMRAGTPVGQGLPTPEIAQQAVDVAINGSKNRVTIIHASGTGDVAGSTGGAASTGAEPESKSRRWAWWIFGIVGVVGVLVAIIALFI